VTLVLCYTGCLANCKLPEWNSTYSNTIDNHFTSIRWDRKWWMKWGKVLWQACQQDKEMCSILSNTESGNFGYWRCLGEEWNTTKVILSWFGEAWDRVSVNRGHCPMTVGWRRWWITESLDCLGMEYSWPWCAFEHSRYGMTMLGFENGCLYPWRINRAEREAGNGVSSRTTSCRRRTMRDALGRVVWHFERGL
jgi:hypothetical protein